MSNDLKHQRERFGRYLILDHLVDGGMAKICRARFLGEQADKVVAIKMVQPQFSKDENFKTMFMDEIKLTFGLIHPNIVQVYDYGVHQEQLFVAMEYCDGRNLKEYLEKLKERKFVFPVEISAFIITQVCQALYYAHTFTDKLTGEERGIIHRDISPHNIMLTYDGTVKVIDFGIAKSKSNSEATQAGTIKGKLSYLAPEYLEGFELDPRYDQFAVGITLWEMLCSRKLFKDNNDLAVLKKIQECKVPPPSSINPNVPKELDEIVLKALSKNRTNRFENMDQFNRALMKFLYSKYPDFNATDLSYFAQELFKEDIKRDREKMFEYGKIDIKPYIEEVKREMSGESSEKRQTSARSSSESRDESPTPRAREVVFDMGFEENDPTSKITKTKKILGKKSGPDDGTNQTSEPKKALRTSTVNRRSQTSMELAKGNTKSMNRRSESTQSIVRKKEAQKKDSVSPFIKIVAVLAIIVSAGAFLFVEFLDSDNASIKLVDVPKQVPRDVKREVASNLKDSETTIVIGQYNKLKHKVFVNDEQRTPDLIGAIIVPIDIPIILRVEVAGKKHFIKELTLTVKKPFQVDVPTDLPNYSYAYLGTSRPCVSGELKFEIFGEKRKQKLPIADSIGISLPLDIDAEGKIIPTTHVVEVFSDDGVSRKVEVVANREEQSIDLCDLLN